MNRFVSFIFITIFCVFLCHSEYYRVDASVLNLRTQPSLDATVKATVKSGEILEVTNINGEWAEVEYAGSRAYVASKYISYTSTKPHKSSKAEFLEHGFNNLIEFPAVPEFLKTTSNIPLYISLSLLACFFLIINFNCDILYESKVVFYVAAMGFLVLCFSEIMYFAGFQGDCTWFCSPQKVGWGWTILNFLIFAVCMFYQILTFYALSIAAQLHGQRSCIPDYGFLVTLLSVAAVGVSGIFFREHINLVLLVDAALFVGWILWCIYVNVRDNGSWTNLMLFIAMWVIGTVATLIALYYFMLLMIIVLIGGLVFYLMGNMPSGSGSTTASSSSSQSEGFQFPVNEEETAVLESSDGEEIRVRVNSDGTMTEKDAIIARKFKEFSNGEITRTY